MAFAPSSLILANNFLPLNEALGVNGDNMATGTENRTAIDTETVKGLLIINGGGAVALLAFLSSIISIKGAASLIEAVIWSIFIFQMGLASAIVYNRTRRLCSLEYAKKPENRKTCNPFGIQLSEPCICHRSKFYMWLSIFFFVLSGSIVFLSGLHYIKVA